MDVFPQDRAGPFLQYDGRVGELYPIFLLNLLLSVVTLGIWRFWAVTRMRRYVWSRTAHAGQRFEYDGTGGQLFVGFLLAIAILFGLGIGAAVLGFLFAQIARPLAVLPIFALYLAIFVLVFGAPFSAQRYRLNHTVWRGIRGGMHGSMIRYGLWSLLYLLASIVTVYQLVPWMRVRLFERRANASFFGSQPVASHSRAMPLYLAWLGTFAALLLLLLVVGAVFWAAEATLIRLLIAASDIGSRNALFALLLPGLLLAYLVLFIGSALIACGFQARFLRHVIGHTTLGGLGFSSDVGGGAILSLIAVNLLILVFTLGFGLPIIIHRNQRFLAQHLLCSGTLDPLMLQQGTQAPSRYGEGMFQALDAGVGLS